MILGIFSMHSEVLEVYSGQIVFKFLSGVGKTLVLHGSGESPPRADLVKTSS